MKTSTAATRQSSRAIGKTYLNCPLCNSDHLEYEFVVDKSPVCGCQACGLLFLNPQPDTGGVDESSPLFDSNQSAKLHETNARERLERLVAYSGLSGGTLLFIGTDPFLAAASKQAGFKCWSLTAPEFEALSDAELPPSVDACVLFCALERMSNPLAALQTIRRILGTGGTLMVVSPTTDSSAARVFRNRWWEFRRSNKFYYSVDTLQSLLIKAGFGDPIVNPDRSVVSLNYLRDRLAGDRKALRRHHSLFRAGMLVRPLAGNKPFRTLYGRTSVLVRAKPLGSTPVVSVIVPAYNEKATFEQLVSQLLAKSIDGIDIQVIIVESNSNDGTREAALKYRDHPRVHLVLESKPLGKGHAVRAGLAFATGDFIIIQDADLEYDLDDYDSLLSPLLRYETNFVLGSRHVGEGSSWKIRDFADSSAMSAYFNFGHLAFLTLFNFLYRQKLTDPFTMFKVFRRECLYGLSFETNRFDFDVELVIRLLRKGYKAREIPVNYRSRSIKEGKKVRPISDPLNWIWAYFKFRFVPLYAKKQ